MPTKLLQKILAALTRVICGISIFEKCVQIGNLQQSIYFANHSSHFDFLAIWSSLPGELRQRTRPIAARDYWAESGLRHFLSKRVFNAILIERGGTTPESDPLIEVRHALSSGDSVIIFPEGTRSLDGNVQDFKKGLYYLMKEFPEVALIPVYLDNLNRVLPKGEFIAVPLLSRVIFGAPLTRIIDEDKELFLDRAKRALMELA